MRTKGFTLIELLVAVVIFLSAVTAISLVYRGALLSSQRASEHVVISSYVPSILKVVRASLRAQPFTLSELSGEGEFEQLEYRWTAQALESKSVSNSPVSGSLTTTLAVQSNSYKLWQVSLKIKLSKVNEEFSFYEVSWRDG